MAYWLRKEKNTSCLVGRALVYVMVILFISLPGLSVNSQSITGLSFQPENVEVLIGNTVIMNLDVKNGVNLSGYDLIIRYDPGIEELTSWAHGTYLSNLAVMRAKLQPGIIELAAVQVAKPGVTGDGTLLSLTFTALNSGSTPVYVESIVLATADGQRVYPTLIDGTIIVKSPATETRTPTITATNTLTPTRTFTSTVTRTPTPVPTLTPTPVFFTTQTAYNKTSSTPLKVTDSPTETQNIDTLLTADETGSAGVFKTTLPFADDSNAGSIEDQGALLVEPAGPISSNLQELNRLLWIFAALLLLILACFIYILLRSKRKANGNH
jgi:hypothetical protein